MAIVKFGRGFEFVIPESAKRKLEKFGLDEFDITKILYEHNGWVDVVANTHSGDLRLGYYESGQLSLEEWPDGTKIGWWDNGKKEFELFPNGEYRTWYQDGKKRSERQADGHFTKWDMDGTVIEDEHNFPLPGAGEPLP